MNKQKSSREHTMIILERGAYEPDGGLLGYCTESPQEVLQRIFEDYVIHEYKGLLCPIDRNARSRCGASMQEGLIIRVASAPRGTKIIGSIDDLDLTAGRAISKSQDRQTEYKEALCFAVRMFGLDFTGEGVKTSKAKLQQYEERDGIALKEVAEVTLGITGKSFKELLDYLRSPLGEHSESDYK